MLIALFVLAAAIWLALYLFFRLYPQFGGISDQARMQQSPNYKGKIFVNQTPTSMAMGFASAISLLQDYIRRDPRKHPAKPIKAEHPVVAKILAASKPELVWFGHSASLLRLNGKTIMLDPMLTRSPFPFPAIGPQRFSDSLPIEIADLPPIDAVLISHDHYDHLDYPTIKQLRGRVTKFFVPLGLAAHLIKWGVKPEQITEMDWWDEAHFEGFTFVCTPSRHFSGRTLTDRFKTLWCSWVIDATDTKLFFSGDTGYGPHFKEIGTKYGPFDLTLMECGQYDERWPNIHMQPEQTLAAHLDLRGKRMMPLHWGAFVLALHPWADSVERVRKAAADVGAKIVTPKIGEVVVIKAAEYPTTPWWKAYS
jgi:L-ascorbate metabolism protein UlaG (beta-lactamase superfamily)